MPTLTLPATTTPTHMPARRMCTECSVLHATMAAPMSAHCALRTGSPRPSGRITVSFSSAGWRAMAASTSEPPGDEMRAVDT